MAPQNNDVFSSTQFGAQLMIKRLFDLIILFIALPIIVPVMMVLTAFVFLTMDSPIFFQQTRAGFRGRPFKLVKFRTMNDRRDTQGALLPDAERLTRVGIFLRSTSLDELPELWNILRGEMSLVGPRPLLLSYLPRYSEKQMRRHDAKPGLTGWVQVNGRNSLNWNEKFELDIWYVDNQNLILDIRILLSTISQVMARRDISANNDATMPEFLGNDQ